MDTSFLSFMWHHWRLRSPKPFGLLCSEGTVLLVILGPDHRVSQGNSCPSPGTRQEPVLGQEMSARRQIREALALSRPCRGTVGEGRVQAEQGSCHTLAGWGPCRETSSLSMEQSHWPRSNIKPYLPPWWGCTPGRKAPLLTKPSGHQGGSSSIVSL